MHWFGRRTLVVLGGLIVTLAFAQAATPPATSTAASSLLSWRPPTLTNPITVALCNCNIQNGVIVVNLAVGQDYVLTDSVVLTDPVLIQGGHNIVWIGGEVQPVGPATGIKLIRNAGFGGGTIHLEGIYIHGADGQLTDGIGGGEWASTYAPRGHGPAQAAYGLRWEGKTVLFSGSTPVEPGPMTEAALVARIGASRAAALDFLVGIQMLGESKPDLWLPSNVSVGRNANLYDEPNSTGNGMQTLLHFGDRTGYFNATTHQQGGALSNVYLHATQKPLDQETYPNSGTATASLDGTVVHSTVNLDGTITWANTWGISGNITAGDPPGGDFVPLGLAGLDYVSPGYQ